VAGVCLAIADIVDMRRRKKSIKNIRRKVPLKRRKEVTDAAKYKNC
jgi:hypothetical protein